VRPWPWGSSRQSNVEPDGWLAPSFASTLKGSHSSARRATPGHARPPQIPRPGRTARDSGRSCTLSGCTSFSLSRFPRAAPWADEWQPFRLAAALLALRGDFRSSSSGKGAGKCRRASVASKSGWRVSVGRDRMPCGVAPLPRTLKLRAYSVNPYSTRLLDRLAWMALEAERPPVLQRAVCSACGGRPASAARGGHGRRLFGLAQSKALRAVSAWKKS